MPPYHQREIDHHERRRNVNGAAVASILQLQCYGLTSLVALAQVVLRYVSHGIDLLLRYHHRCVIEIIIFTSAGSRSTRVVIYILYIVMELSPVPNVTAAVSALWRRNFSRQDGLDNYCTGSCFCPALSGL